MFVGPNILLKLHVARVYILRDIAIFIFGPFGYVHAHFGGVLGDMKGFPLELGIGAGVQKKLE